MYTISERFKSIEFHLCLCFLVGVQHTRRKLWVYAHPAERYDYLTAMTPHRRDEPMSETNSKRSAVTPFCVDLDRVASPTAKR